MIDVIVIGAGHCGLNLSYRLKDKNINHIVLESGCIGNSWATQRWGSMRLNTPNKLNRLNGWKFDLKEEDNFLFAKEFADKLQLYAKDNNLPVEENTKVVEVLRDENDGLFKISVEKQGERITYHARQIVVASGTQNNPYSPDLRSNLPAHIRQLHASEYKSPSQLCKGGVLVVGTGQSGYQIAEELLKNKFRVHVATSAVGFAPRKYKGKDIEDWLVDISFYEKSTDENSDNFLSTSPQPIITNSDSLTPAILQLETAGAKLYGSVKEIKENVISFKDNLIENIDFSIAYFNELTGMIDGKIISNTSDLSSKSHQISPVYTSPELNLDAAEIKTVIWATGFIPRFDFLKLPIFSPDRALIHSKGETIIPGLYFLGIPSMRKKKSGIIYGAIDDGEYIIDKIVSHSKQNDLVLTQPVV